MLWIGIQSIIRSWESYSLSISENSQYTVHEGEESRGKSWQAADLLFQPLAVSGYLRFRQKRSQPRSEISLLHSRWQLLTAFPPAKTHSERGTHCSRRGSKHWVAVLLATAFWGGGFSTGKGDYGTTWILRELPVIFSWVFTRVFHLLVDNTCFLFLEQIIFLNFTSHLENVPSLVLLKP